MRWWFAPLAYYVMICGILVAYTAIVQDPSFPGSSGPIADLEFILTFGAVLAVLYVVPGLAGYGISIATKFVWRRFVAIARA